MQHFRQVIFLTIITLVSTQATKAQDWEIGGWGGISNYIGDLNNQASFEFIGPGAGLFARYNINTRFANKAGLSYGQIEGSDAGSTNAYEKARNLSFKSNVIEVADEIEFNFFKYDKRKPDLRFTPYIFLGISAFYFNPTTDYNGQTYSLQPIGTEGQNDPASGKSKYLRVSLGFPVGGGFKYSFHPAWALGVEFGFRKTLTRYLDDVSGVYPDKLVSYTTSNTIAKALSDRSGEVGEAFGKPGKQRGTTDKTDSYLFFGLTLSYTMLKERCPKISRIH